jgi:hypothetical protein
MTALSPSETLLAFLVASNADFHEVLDRPEHRELVVTHSDGLFLLDYDEAATAIQVDHEGRMSVST